MFDAKIVSMYQWIVDTTEKKPGWWAEHVIIGSTMLNIVTRVLKWENNWDMLMLLISLTVGALLVFTARNEAQLKHISSTGWIRPFLLGCSAMGLSILIMKPTPIHGLDLISTVLFASYYYFGACENPRPKKRKESFVRKFA